MKSNKQPMKYEPLPKMDRKDLMYHPDSLIQKWMEEQMQPTGKLDGHQLGVECLIFNSQNPNELISGSHDKLIKKWDISRQEMTQNIQGHDLGVWSLCQNISQPNQLASAGCDKLLILHDLRTNKSQKPVNMGGAIYSVCFTDDHQQLVCANDNHQVLIYDVRKAKVANTITTDAKINYSVCMDKKGELMVISDFNGGIHLYNQKTTKQVCCYQPTYPYENRQYSVTMDWQQKGTQQQVIAGGQDGIVRVFRYEGAGTLTLQKEFYAATEPITSLTIHSQLGYLLSTSKEAYSKIWAIDSFGFQKSLVGHLDNASCGAITQVNGRKVFATGSWDQKINIYQL